MKTPEQWFVEIENSFGGVHPTKIYAMVQSDARADLKAENRALREKLFAVEVDNREYETTFNLQHKRTVAADKLWRTAHPERGEVMPDLGELIGWLLERAESAEASFKQRDLQMRAALEETESMFQRTQRAETENVELRERLKAMKEILKDCQHLRSQVFPLACFPECPACRWKAMKEATA